MRTLTFLPGKLLNFLFATFILFSFTGCEGKQSATQDAATVEYAPPAPAAREPQSREEGQEEPQFEQKIIRNANLRFQVADYPESLNTIRSLLKSFGAILVSSNEMRVDNSLENTMVIRVPSRNLDALIARLAEQSIYLDYKNITSEDVTTEFVDISARLKTKKAVEQRYLELLKQAKNVKEIIEVENQLRQIQEEIESTQARVNYINRQVSFSTINLQIYENSARQTGEQNFLVRLLNAFRNGWELLLSFMVGLLYIWPFILLLLLVVFGLRKFFRKHPPVR